MSHIDYDKIFEQIAQIIAGGGSSSDNGNINNTNHPGQGQIITGQRWGRSIRSSYRSRRRRGVHFESVMALLRERTAKRGKSATKKLPERTSTVDLRKEGSLWNWG